MIYLQLQLRTIGSGAAPGLAEVMVNCTILPDALTAAAEVLGRSGWTGFQVISSENFVGRPDAALLHDPLLYARAKFSGVAVRVSRGIAEPVEAVCEPAA